MNRRKRSRWKEREKEESEGEVNRREHLRHPKQYILTASMMGNIFDVVVDVVALVSCHFSWLV